MYCKKCGFKLEEDATICPYCNSSVSEEERPKEEPKFERFERNDYPTYEESNVEDNPAMDSDRNVLGYLNIGTQFWHHILIGVGGYLIINILSIIIAPIIVAIMKANGVDFACIANNPTNYADVGVCDPSVVVAYTKANAITQVIAELMVIVAVILIFMKKISKLFKQFKDKKTWMWFGIAIAIMYGGAILYSMILEVLKLTSGSSNQDAVNEVIYSSPVLGFLFVVVAAPLFEEIVFRFGIFRAFTFKNKTTEIVGLIVTIFLFASIHMVMTLTTAITKSGIDWELMKTDFLSFPVYIIGAFGLTFAYYKSKNLATCLITHMAYNFISFIAIIMTRYFPASDSILFFLR